ncbi:MAG: aminoacetone oxidase family FAD-binding enzyme [Eubacteriales bacterium]|nr:aminoacetone oxidase family FAD-binding enzyme [Eubacteriales bacterium]
MGKRILIIGGGASGLMASITAAEAGASVTVLERNERPGHKILASGNGRCNLTNLDMSVSHYRGERGLAETVLRDFSEKDTLSFFQRIGLDTIDKSGWVYPQSEQAAAVLQLLLLRAAELKVKIKTNENVVGAEVRKAADGASVFAVQTETWTYEADRVLVCCGSPASSVRGSGDTAEKIAKAFAVDQIPFLPALVSLKTAQKDTKNWAGTRVRAKVVLRIDKEIAAEDCGEVQLTEYGISGIPVFQISGSAVRACEEGRRVNVELELLPETGYMDLYERLLRIHQNFPERDPAQLLTGILPEKLIPVVVSGTASASGVQKKAKHGKKKAARIDLQAMEEAERRQFLQKLTESIKHIDMQVTGASSMRQAQICSGGIKASELTERLESIRVPGLYFCGEAVNVDGECGGYNLQWAWASGHLAGLAAAEE